MHKKIEVVIFDGALPLDISGATAVFSAATALLQEAGLDGGYDFCYAAKELGTFSLDGNFPMCIGSVIGETGYNDMLLIPGGLGVDAAIADVEFMKKVHHAVSASVQVVSVCTGSGILAAIGILDGRTAATHWVMASEFSARYPQVHFDSSVLFQRDGHVYTSAGVSTGIDLALSIVEEDFGHELAMRVARLLVVYYRRPGWQTQFSPLLEAQTRLTKRFAKLQEWILQNFSQKLSVELLAEKAGMSSRNFARVFGKETGKTPGKYVEEVRLEHARAMLEAGECDFDRVALISGFGREERMRRAFVRTFGVSPRQYRSHFSVAKERVE